ncbi:translocon-associated protein subunit beta, partial [Clonorchis sinensis]
MVFHVFFSCIFIFLTVSGQGSDVARLAVSKQVLNEYIFQGKELTILYTIYNLHSRLCQTNRADATINGYPIKQRRFRLVLQYNTYP